VKRKNLHNRIMMGVDMLEALRRCMIVKTSTIIIVIYGSIQV